MSAIERIGESAGIREPSSSVRSVGEKSTNATSAGVATVTARSTTPALIPAASCATEIDHHINRPIETPCERSPGLAGERDKAGPHARRNLLSDRIAGATAGVILESAGMSYCR
jgi:hypothetical protein